MAAKPHATRHQVYMINGDTSMPRDENGNPIINPDDILSDDHAGNHDNEGEHNNGGEHGNRGETTDNRIVRGGGGEPRIEERTGLQLPASAWQKAREAISGAVLMTADASHEDLLSCQYLLHHKKRDLLRMQRQLDEIKRLANESSLRRA